MDILLDPNVAYLILVAGFLVAVLAIFSPGTGFLEVGAILALLLAGYAMYNLPINGWALVVLAVGVFPFLLAVRKSGRWIYLIASIIALVVGSVFLFRSDTGSPAIHPALATVVSIVTIGFLWLVARKSLEAIEQRPSHDLDSLIGMVGETRTRVYEEGTVYADGETWSARSRTPIPPNTRVRVTGRDGFVLEVEKAESTDGADPALQKINPPVESNDLAV
jgi:membrane-bound serine protease (ClpP class)